MVNRLCDFDRRTGSRQHQRPEYHALVEIEPQPALGQIPFDLPPQTVADLFQQSTKRRRHVNVIRPYHQDRHIYLQRYIC
jgi:hypothetical protein